MNLNAQTIFTKGNNFPFYLTLLYLFLEFGRPQELIADLGAFRIPAVVTILLAISLIISGKLMLSEMQTKQFLLLLSLMAFHIPFSTNNYWAFHVAKAMLITFVAYLSVITFVDSFQKFKTMINVWICIHVWLAVNGHIKGGRGIGGFLGDENDFCMTLNMIIPFVFFMILSETSKLKKLVYLSLSALFLLVIMLTLSRGGFVGLVAVGIYCFVRSPKKILSGVLIGLLILFMFRYAPEKYWNEIKSIQEEKGGQGTGQERVYQWKIGWKIFLDNPVLGVGQGNFAFEFSRYEGEERFDGRSLSGRVAHSLYFTLMPELGIVGTLIFLRMLYCIYKDIKFISNLRTKKILRKSEQELDKLFYLGRAIEGSLIGFLVSGIFISILYYPNFWFLMGFVVALRKVVSQNYGNNFIDASGHILTSN